MDSRYVRYATAALVVVALVIVFLPRRMVVDVTNVGAISQEFGPPMVSATLTNKGDEIRVRYWVETDRLGEHQCEGTVMLARNQSFDLSFECPALKDHTGKFTLETEPAD